VAGKKQAKTFYEKAQNWLSPKKNVSNFTFLKHFEKRWFYFLLVFRQLILVPKSYENFGRFGTISLARKSELFSIDLHLAWFLGRLSDGSTTKALTAFPKPTFALPMPCRSDWKLSYWRGATNLSITTFNIMTPSLRGFYVTLSITMLCHYADCNYAKYRI